MLIYAFSGVLTYGLPFDLPERTYPIIWGIGWESLMPSTGTVRPLVVILEFPDDNISHDGDEAVLAVREYVLSQMQEATELFYQQSFGRLNIQIELDDIFFHRTSRNRNRYISLLARTFAHHMLMGEIIGALEETGIDFSVYDSNGDGFIDSLFLLISSSDGLLADGYARVICDANLTIDGKTFGSYMVSPYPTDNPWNFWIQVHEIGHVLGLEDHYRVRNSAVLDLNLSDIMVCTSGRYFNIFSRFILDWVDPVVLTPYDPVQEIKIYAVERGGSAHAHETKAVVFTSNYYELPFTEYFIIEYRRGINEDSGFYENPGIMVWQANSALTYRGYSFTNMRESIQIVPQSGRANTRFSRFSLSEDMFTPGDVFSESGFFMEVIETNFDYAIIRAGSL